MTDVPRQSLTEAPARKALGQHFLHDPSILNRVALAAGPVQDRTVIEVGPGPGGLTRSLIEAGAHRVIAVEMDDRFAAALRNWPAHLSGQLYVHQGDARKVDWEDLVATAGGSSPAMIVANLPYNVGTPLLIDWLKAGLWRGEMALMFQKEVAERVAAKSGEAHYGRLAVLTAAVASAHIALTLPPGAFRPPPKVDSAVVVVTPLPTERIYSHLSMLEKVTEAAFGQRRKMLRASLKRIANQHNIDVADWLSSCNITPTDRPDTLDQADWRALTDVLVAKLADV